MRYEIVLEARERGWTAGGPWIRRTYLTAASVEEAIQLAIEYNLDVTVVERPELRGAQTLVDYR
jgi:hypothetical protein